MTNETQLMANMYFGAPVYYVDKPEFLDSVNLVSNEKLIEANQNRGIDDVYPVIMSNWYMNDPRISDFEEFIKQHSLAILYDQGYNIDGLIASITEMWTQEHFKSSSMEQHTHGHGSQIVGFYFLEVPENAPFAIFHDPRHGKSFIDLPERNPSEVTIASKMVNYTPKPGLMLFTNAWLPHSFTRNPSHKSFKFVHFNVSVQFSHNCNVQEVEII